MDDYLNNVRQRRRRENISKYFQKYMTQLLLSLRRSELLQIVYENVYYAVYIPSLKSQFKTLFFRVFLLIVMCMPIVFNMQHIFVA